MIDADDIDEVVETPHAIGPPGVALGAIGSPVEDGVAPELPGLREVVGRHSGDVGRIAGRVELEQLTVGPDIGAVQSDEDRHVPDDLHPSLVGVEAERLPLAAEQILDEGVIVDVVRQLDSPTCKGRRVPQPGGIVPRLPRSSAMRVLYRHEEREIVEPVCGPSHEREVVGGRGALGGAPPGMSAAKHSLLRKQHRAKIDPMLREVGIVGEILAHQ